MPLLLKFHGALTTVTGSCHFFKVKGSGNIYAVDCGATQGEDDDEQLALPRNLPRDCTSDKLSGIILTHAHGDHINHLPRWFQAGFKGQIFCTRETAKLAEIALHDSRRIEAREGKDAVDEASLDRTLEALRSAKHVQPGSPIAIPTAAKGRVKRPMRAMRLLPKYSRLPLSPTDDHSDQTSDSDAHGGGQGDYGASHKRRASKADLQASNRSSCCNWSIAIASIDQPKKFQLDRVGDRRSDTRKPSAQDRGYSSKADDRNPTSIATNSSSSRGLMIRCRSMTAGFDYRFAVRYAARKQQ